MNEIIYYLVIIFLLLYIFDLLTNYSYKIDNFDNVDSNKLKNTDKTNNDKFEKITKPDELLNKTFKLQTFIPNMPPYIKGKEFENGSKDNTFCLSVEKLNPNCSLSFNNTCLNVYVDNKDCSNSSLSSYVQNDSNRLVLIPLQNVLDEKNTLGKNSDMTLIKVNEKYYLQNVKTGYFLSLYKNDIKGQKIYGNMIDDPASNISTIVNNNNTLCLNNVPQTKNTNFVSSSNPNCSNIKQHFISCNLQVDDTTMYLLLTKNITSASPIEIIINSDNTITLNVIEYNLYGQTKIKHPLSACNFNIKDGSFIETITNELGNTFINLVCIDGNALKFNVIS